MTTPRPTLPITIRRTVRHGTPSPGLTTARAGSTTATFRTTTPRPTLPLTIRRTARRGTPSPGLTTARAGSTARTVRTTTPRPTFTITIRRTVRRGTPSPGLTTARAGSTTPTFRTTTPRSCGPAAVMPISRRGVRNRRLVLLSAVRQPEPARLHLRSERRRLVRLHRLRPGERCGVERRHRGLRQPEPARLHLRSERRRLVRLHRLRPGERRGVELYHFELRSSGRLCRTRLFSMMTALVGLSEVAHRNSPGYDIGHASASSGGSPYLSWAATRSAIPVISTTEQVNMMKIAILLALSLVATEASAQYQNRTYYGPSGSVTGRSTTSSSGQTTFYGSSGNVTARAAPSSNGTTTFYGPSGNVTGRVTTSPSYRR